MGNLVFYSPVDPLDIAPEEFISFPGPALWVGGGILIKNKHDHVFAGDPEKNEFSVVITGDHS